MSTETDKIKSNPLILKDAISDAGYWSFWVASLPDSFQLEFRLVQIFVPPKPGEPPSNTIALSFKEPYAVDFLTFSEPEILPDNWPKLMSQDKLKLDYRVEILFNDPALIGEKLSEVKHSQRFFGSGFEKEKSFNANFLCLVRTENMGVIVASEGLKWHSASENNLSIDEIPARNQKWWKYWEKYWDHKNTNTPLPEDHLCEVTIPIKK